MSELTRWMHGMGGDATETARALADAGFDIVVAGGDETIKAVGEAGMRSWLCGGAFGLGDSKEKAVDINGDEQVWFGSGCPNSGEIREQNRQAYRKMAATEGVEGILVDGCRFASPASGLMPFLTCFCERCEKKAGELQLDFARMKKDVRALHSALVSDDLKQGGGLADWFATAPGALDWLADHPGLADWLHFRKICATEHFRDVGEIIHEGGKQMGVYIFTPSLAPLVGQSYRDLREPVDVFAPMIYRNYKGRPGIACFNWELTIIPEELGLAGAPGEHAVMNLLLAWCNVADTTDDRSVEGLQKELPPESVGRQTALARALIGSHARLDPILFIDDPRMDETVASTRAAGADGVNFFAFRDDWRNLVAPAFKA